MTGLRTALKEWAVLVHAFAEGEIVLTLRKGGIREQRAGFSVRHDRFLLYPTFFHEKLSELDPRFHARMNSVERPPTGMIPFGYMAEAIAVWQVTDLERLREVQPLQGLTASALEFRYHYRGRPGVQAIALRVSRLARPTLVPESRRYLGCVSWVNLDEALDVAGAAPVLDEAAFSRRLRAVRDVLGDPTEPAGP